MYYVAFFIDLKKNFIVPKQWIQNIKSHKEKFYNNGVNSNQVFTCFYTNHPDAFDEDGLPNGLVQANFLARASKTLNGDGLFRVNLKTFKGISIKIISQIIENNKITHIFYIL